MCACIERTHWLSRRHSSGLYMPTSTKSLGSFIIKSRNISICALLNAGIRCSRFKWVSIVDGRLANYFLLYMKKNLWINMSFLWSSFFVTTLPPFLSRGTLCFIWNFISHFYYLVTNNHCFHDWVGEEEVWQPSMLWYINGVGRMKRLLGRKFRKEVVVF